MVLLIDELFKRIREMDAAKDGTCDVTAMCM